MVLPFIMTIAAAQNGGAHHGHAAHLSNAASDPATGLIVMVMHGAAYLLITALAAWLVFAKFGLALLRTAWVNLDLVWAAALIITGALTVAL
jgi:hypothetical protein